MLCRLCHVKKEELTEGQTMVKKKNSSVKQIELQPCILNAIFNRYEHAGKGSAKKMYKGNIAVQVRIIIVDDA